MNITYNIIKGIEMPDVVRRTNNWRQLRESLEAASVNEPVLIHLKSADYPDRKSMVSAVDAARAGAYSYGDSANINKRGLRIVTTSVPVSTLPDNVVAQLGKKGVTDPQDKIVICKKIRVNEGEFVSVS